MICIKTGFYATMFDGQYLYGDAFASTNLEWPDERLNLPEVDLLLRVTSMSDEKPPRVHIVLSSWSHWFDEGQAQKLGDNCYVWHPCSTLVANAGDWSWMGYDGVLT